jgi:hypothetical protein
MNPRNYEGLKKTLEDNELFMNELTDEIFGDVYKIVQTPYKGKLSLSEATTLKERLIFYKEGLRFMNQISLKMIKEG